MEVEEATKSDLNCLIAMKHVCKFCHKRFPCGRSLGGHMRSHLITTPSDPEVKKKIKNQDPNQIKCCKECGKIFHSSKALSGHMKSHAVEREKEKQREKENKNILLGDEIDKESDNEAGSNCRRPRRRSNRRQITTTSSSSVVSEINDQQEQEEVAMCLIMLSRDVGPWFNWVESSKDEGSILNLGKTETVLVQPEVVSAALSDIETGKRKTKLEGGLEESEKRCKFECTTCNKTFHSYQALGGHRASHKKAKGCSPLKPDCDEIISIPTPKKGGSLMVQKHECPICFKEFPSGQALGGHKRSHLVAASSLETKFVSVVEKSNATTLTATTTITTGSHEVRDFLDLNLPAPVEEEASFGPHQPQQQLDLVGFKPWWVESITKHEQLVGLI